MIPALILSAFLAFFLGAAILFSYLINPHETKRLLCRFGLTF